MCEPSPKALRPARQVGGKYNQRENSAADPLQMQRAVIIYTTQDNWHELGFATPAEHGRNLQQLSSSMLRNPTDAGRRQQT